MSNPIVPEYALALHHAEGRRITARARLRRDLRDTVNRPTRAKSQRANGSG